MAIKISVSDTVAFSVSGTLSDENGAPQKFQFTLIARRLLSDELQSWLDDKDLKVPDFMSRLVSGWRSVLDDQGNQVQFSPEALAALFQIPGVASLAFRQYLIDIGAKEKN